MSIHDTAWLDALDDLEIRAEAAVRAALDSVGGRAGIAAAVPLEISLVFTDDAEQQGLNRDFRGKDSPTNVLSFPNMDETQMPGIDANGAPRLLGDVVLARETVLREADEQAKRPGDHVSHLLVHGVLHLLGYDHEEADEAEEMESLEREILARLEIADPYASGAEVVHG